MSQTEKPDASQGTLVVLVVWRLVKGSTCARVARSGGLSIHEGLDVRTLWQKDACSQTGTVGFPELDLG